MHNGKYWSELTEEERQKYPGDAEAQISQGSQPKHSDWHLATSDKGVAMVQRMLKTEVKKTQEGKNPVGTCFDPDTPPIEVKSGNYYS